ncbi:MAG: trimethylamine methyltransferase family protein [Actinobacteria bacterium]|nr:trimethylamine methyltransferase family protein [Actinomycetota bacterium]
MYRPSRIRFLEDSDLQKIHGAGLKLLEDPGLKVMEPEMREALKKLGAKVNDTTQMVSFPSNLIEIMIEEIRKEIAQGKTPNILNGPMASKTDGKLAAKFGGACIEIYDFETDTVRKPTRQELIDSIQLGEALDEVGLVGNTIMYIEEEGKAVDPKMQRIKTAEIVAKNTSKPASTEVWNARELEFLIEIGVVVRRSMEEYLKRPCFVTAKETITPFQLTREAGEVLVALAKRGLPVTIIPMPISGVSSPVTPASSLAIANAEILGVMAAVRAVVTGAPVAGGITSGVMNMATGSAVFGAPEAIWQDMALAELYEVVYGQDLGIGVGNIDAKYPGIEAAAEKSLKILLAYLSARTNYMVGDLAAMTRFSAEEAIIELEIAKSIHRTFEGYEFDDKSFAIDLIRKVGPGGNFVQEDHTYENFRKALWHSDVFDKSLTTGNISEDKMRDILINANLKIKDILSKKERFHLSEEQEKEIDRIVKKAEEFL